MNPCLAITVDVEPDYWDDSTTEGLERGIPLLLDLFDTLGAKGTFFWVAESAEKCSKIFDQVVARGHEIGCHGLAHENFLGLSAEQQAETIHKATSRLRAMGGHCIGFRAPRLRVNDSLFAALAGAGYLYDSSVPYWGLRTFKYGKRYDHPEGIVELKCIPSYAFRFSHCLFQSVLHHSCRELGYAVLFVHPWEFVTMPKRGRDLSMLKRLNFLNTYHVGPTFARQLSTFLLARRDDLEIMPCSRIIKRKDSTCSGEKYIP